jgi:enoyl-CoA hydratase/carnithine racemase
MTYETILIEQRDAVTLVTLNRPQALNALNSHRRLRRRPRPALPRPDRQ